MLVWWAPADIQTYRQYTERGPVKIPTWYDRQNPILSSLSVEKLAKKYAQTTLTKWLRINEAELDYWIKWSGPDPMDSPLEALQFLELYHTLKQAGLSSLDLRFLLQHDPAGPLNADVLREQVEQQSISLFSKFRNAINDAGINKEPSKLTPEEVKAIAKLKAISAQLGGQPLVRLFNLRHDFPTEFHAWKQNGVLNLDLIENRHFPYFAQGRINKTLTAVKLLTNDSTAEWWTNNITLLTVPDKSAGKWPVSYAGQFDEAKDYYLRVDYKLNE